MQVKRKSHFRIRLVHLLPALRCFVIIVDGVLIFLFLVFDKIAVTCYAFDCVFRFLSVFNTTSQTARCSPSLKTRKLQLLMNTTPPVVLQGFMV